MYEFFEHTADLGLRAFAPSLVELFSEMGHCLMAALLDNPSEIRARQSFRFEITGTNPEDLLFDFLREVLYRFESEKFLGDRFEIQFHSQGLTAEIHGESFDPTRHVLSHEVKAITYHELRVVQEGSQWLAEVIVDI